MVHPSRRSSARAACSVLRSTIRPTARMYTVGVGLGNGGTAVARAYSNWIRLLVYTLPPPMADYRRKRWRNEMAVRIDVNGALEWLVGEGGLPENELASLEQHVAGAHAAMDAKRKSKSMRFRDLP